MGVVIKIIGCTDSRMWYNEYIGEYFRVLNYYDNGDVRVRTPSGFTSIVKEQDYEEEHEGA